MPEHAEGRTPPHDLEAEESVLGSLLLDVDAIARVHHLRPDDFYRPQNGEVFRACRELFGRGEPIDQVTLCHQLEAMGMLERSGGRAGVALLAERVPTAANVEHYAGIVVDAAIKRRTIKVGGEIAAKGFDLSLSAEDTVALAQREVFRLAEQGVTSEPESMQRALSSFLTDLEEAVANPSQLVGISTGFATLDRIFTMTPGDLIIVAGRSSMGKTTLAINMALRVALGGLPVAIFSLEMNQKQLVNRLVAQHARVDGERLRRGQLSDDEMARVVEAVAELETAPMSIDEQTNTTEATLGAKARQLAIKYGQLGLVVVDYIQKLKSSKDWKENRVQEVGHLSRAMKDLARELRCPVLVASQLSRGVDSREDKRPRMSDLRESGDLEQDADVVLGLYRPDYYDDQDQPGMAEAIVLKNRNGDTGTVRMRFAKNHNRFDDLTYREAAKPKAQEVDF